MEDHPVGKLEDTFSDGQAHLYVFNCRVVLLSALWLAAASFYLLTWK